MKTHRLFYSPYCIYIPLQYLNGGNNIACEVVTTDHPEIFLGKEVIASICAVTNTSKMVAYSQLLLNVMYD